MTGQEPGDRFRCGRGYAGGGCVVGPPGDCVLNSTMIASASRVEISPLGHSEHVLSSGLLPSPATVMECSPPGMREQQVVRG